MKGMKPMRVLSVALALLVTTAATAAAEDVPVIPTDHGAAVKDVLYARPFTLETAYVNEWSQDKPQVTAGHILVLDVDREFVRPRNVHVPVLYVGARPAEVTHVGYESGHLVVLVLGNLDLTQALIYFGSEQLPEQVDPERGRMELEAARDLGIRPFPERVWDAAFARGGGSLELRNYTELYGVVQELIKEYAPEDAE